MSEERKILNVYKGILDIFQELDRAKDDEEVMALYAEYLKLQVQLSTNHPVFQAQSEGFNYGNCYTYALDLKCPDIFWNRCKKINYFDAMGFDVGLINAKKRVCIRNCSEEMLINSFYSDCDSLKIDVYDISWLDFVPEHNGYIILMYKNERIDTNYDYHFVRINSDGLLSHREGFNGDIFPLRKLSDVNDRYKFVKAFEIVKPVIRERIL